MRLREPVVSRHIHQWSLYSPGEDQDLELVAGVPMLAEHRPWAYRQCGCGVKMRCRTSALLEYPHAFRAYADEAWEDV